MENDYYLIAYIEEYLRNNSVFCLEQKGNFIDWALSRRTDDFYKQRQPDRT